MKKIITAVSMIVAALTLISCSSNNCCCQCKPNPTPCCSPVHHDYKGEVSSKKM